MAALIPITNLKLNYLSVKKEAPFHLLLSAISGQLSISTGHDQSIGILNSPLPLFISKSMPSFSFDQKHKV